MILFVSRKAASYFSSLNLLQNYDDSSCVNEEDVYISKFSYNYPRYCYLRHHSFLLYKSNIYIYLIYNLDKKNLYSIRIFMITLKQYLGAKKKSGMKIPKICLIFVLSFLCILVCRFI